MWRAFSERHAYSLILSETNFGSCRRLAAGKAALRLPSSRTRQGDTADRGYQSLMVSRLPLQAYWTSGIRHD